MFILGYLGSTCFSNKKYFSTNLNFQYLLCLHKVIYSHADIKLQDKSTQASSRNQDSMTCEIGIVRRCDFLSKEPICQERHRCVDRVCH